MSDGDAKQPGTGEPVANFETGLLELEKLVKEMEASNLPLERSLELFERGMELTEKCRKQLQEAETRVETIVKRGGKHHAEPYRSER